ncbi:MAG: pseudouridine-5'-phosphate glycosidase [Flavobacteriales bacterium]|nr:pseudouridine-5'-phosphate glycosidase [Flavobacteriales bacterium]
MSDFLHILPEVQEALKSGQAVVALESTIVAHGMPYPQNLETAQRLESIVRAGGAVPATVAVINGKLQVGCTIEDLTALATSPDVLKVSRRDLPLALARKKLGATTVSGTLIGCELAGIRVFATGGIGGVHRGVERTWDISADIPELAKSSVAVVSAGAKSILDLPKTLEALETAGVTVVGYATDEFPAFFIPTSGIAAPHRVDSAQEMAAAMDAKWSLGLKGGFLIANPIPVEFSADPLLVQHAIDLGLKEAASKRVTGKDLTPFLLRYVNEATEGKSLAANRALVEHNVSVGTAVAVTYASR